jgi:hypothetical protein
LAAVVALLAFVSAALAAADERCSVPEWLMEPQASLPNTTLEVKRRQRLDVVVLSGSPSQTGAPKGLRAYPSFFEAALRERLPGVEIRVNVRAAPRRSVIEMRPDLLTLLTDLRPALVVWQAGTVEAYRGIDADGFGRALEAGVSEAMTAGADVVLVDMQYSPRTSVLVDVAPYLENMRRVAETMDIPLFNRYEIMRHWSETGVFDLSSLKNNGLFEKIHLCVGRLLADFVLRGASLTNFKGQ